TAHAPYYDYQNSGSFCGMNATSRQGLGALGAETRKGVPIWNTNTAKALSPNIFLICGNRAWQGIPKNVFGGPCYLGKLKLLAPDQNWWRHLTKTNIRQKRAVTGLAPDCNDQVTLLSTTERVFLSIFVPGAAAGAALNELGKLACWAEKQANVTTDILGSLLEDQNSLRHTILQNRAALDFLLLAQGHGCEDFDSMCCMNLSDHSESIHKQLQWLKDHANKIQQHSGFLDNFFTNLFGSLPSCLLGLLTEGFHLLIVLIIIGIIGCAGFS
ncbi:ERB1 protein, partial [Nyctiprogne leucopyga]|nr:ERB1 protein [Nyctiprogne leucopyga]